MSHTLLEASSILVLLTIGRVAAHISGHLTGFQLHAMPTPDSHTQWGRVRKAVLAASLYPSAKDKGFCSLVRLSVFEKGSHYVV